MGRSARCSSRFPNKSWVNFIRFRYLVGRIHFLYHRRNLVRLRVIDVPQYQISIPKPIILSIFSIDHAQFKWESSLERFLNHPRLGCKLWPKLRRKANAYQSHVSLFGLLRAFCSFSKSFKMVYDLPSTQGRLLLSSIFFIGSQSELHAWVPQFSRLFGAVPCLVESKLTPGPANPLAQLRNTITFVAYVLFSQTISPGPQISDACFPPKILPPQIWNITLGVVVLTIFLVIVLIAGFIILFLPNGTPARFYVIQTIFRCFELAYPVLVLWNFSSLRTRQPDSSSSAGSMSRSPSGVVRTTNMSHSSSYDTGSEN